jgi:hypothetical protein
VGTPYPPAEEARQRAEDILARPEYRPPDKSLLQRAFDWLDEAVRSFLNSLLSGGAASIVAWIVLAALVGVVVVVALRVSRSVQRVPAVPIDNDPAPRRSPRDWSAEAERHEAAGEWKDAIRCHHRSLVATLIERELLRDVPGRTTGEFRAELHEHAPDSTVVAFALASDLFEAAWYGDAPTGAEQVARFRQLADQVLGRVPA